ncbi:hypothetical protein M378DRAFT_854105 [Amanita muscaria Koide BX008]|uniref:Uncharacterized protein n=1 Tax=Amanita muscaria (strain Koide BX008) TaxID=946122 RepID=A0A0C2WXJ9_AMAMK|nr:hypothetical protein M378DRAFT_854105 [Amanita muscaria Koide BX008]
MTIIVSIEQQFDSITDPKITGKRIKTIIKVLHQRRELRWVWNSGRMPESVAIPAFTIMKRHIITWASRDIRRMMARVQSRMMMFKDIHSEDVEQSDEG